MDLSDDCPYYRVVPPSFLQQAAVVAKYAHGLDKGITAPSISEDAVASVNGDPVRVALLMWEDVQAKARAAGTELPVTLTMTLPDGTEFVQRLVPMSVAHVEFKPYVSAGVAQ